MPRYTCRNCGRRIDGDAHRCPECGIDRPLPMGPKTDELANFLVAAAIVVEFFFLLVVVARLWGT